MARTKHTDKKRKIEEVSEEEVSGEEEEQNAQTNTCEKCNKNTLFTVCSRGCDNNYWTFPNGKEGEGYMPIIQNGFGDSDGLQITICCDCGALQGLNLAQLRQKVLDAQDD